MPPASDGASAPPRDSASVVLLRDGTEGLEVLLMRRSSGSSILGGAYVFPGGKLESDDASPTLLARLDRKTAELHQELSEPQLTPMRAAALYVAAIRETAEEAHVAFVDCAAGLLPPGKNSRVDPFSKRIERTEGRLRTSALTPWSRWITPPNPTLINRRFDTRFFLAALPDQQQVSADGYELTEMRWFRPQGALAKYAAGEIDLIPPQIMSLMHLTLYHEVAEALEAARARPPALVVSEPALQDGILTIHYPGDVRHTIKERALPLPLPTRLVQHGRRMEPPGGLVPHWTGGGMTRSD